MIEISIFNDQVSKDLDEALQTLDSWGQKWIDLRESIYADTVIDDISDEQREILTEKLRPYKFNIGCLGTRRLVASTGSGEKEMSVLEGLIKTALVVKTNFIRVCNEERTGDLKKCEEYARATVPNMRKLCDRAAEYNITVVLENKPSSITNRGCELREFVELVDRPNLKVVWDAVNSWQGGLYDVMNDYKEVKDILGVVHLRGAVGKKDNPKVYSQSELLGEDDFPNKEIVKKLVADGYRGRITLDLSIGSIKRYKDKEMTAAEVSKLSLDRMKKMVICNTK